MMAALLKIIRGLGHVLFPPLCPACDGRPVEDGAVFCSLCRMTLDEVEPVVLFPDGWAVKQLISPLGYGGAVSDAIIRCKHGGMPAFMRPLTILAAGYVKFPAVDIIVPVPLHRRRLARRGFNQSSLIAKAVSKLTRADWSPSILKRVKDTGSQGGLSRAARFQNTQSAFAVAARKSRSIAGKRILLVDDVWTTGATCHACATRLLRAGAKEVNAFTLCRVTH